MTDRFTQKIIDTVTSGELPSADLADAAARVEAAREKARQRAERFGLPYQEPKLYDVISSSEAKRLALQREPGQRTGFDVLSDEQAEKRKARAERFGYEFDFKAEAAKAAGLNDEEIRLRAERRERAAKFGIDDELDIAIAKAALEALVDGSPSPKAAAAAGDSGSSSSSSAAGGDDEAAMTDSSAAGANSTSDTSDGNQMATEEAEEPLPPPTPRPAAIHLRVHKYLPAASGDIIAYFAEAGYRPSFIEWLNGRMVNVLFEDAATARRALEAMSEQVPKVKSVAPVDPAWRVCLKPLVKQRTDKYAVAGSQITVYLRPATSHDDKRIVGGTSGPRTHGTYSEGGEYSLAKAKATGGGSDNRQQQGFTSSYDEYRLGGGSGGSSSEAPKGLSIVKPDGTAYTPPPAPAPVMRGRGSSSLLPKSALSSDIGRVTSHVAEALRRAADDVYTNKLLPGDPSLPPPVPSPTSSGSGNGGGSNTISIVKRSSSSSAEGGISVVKKGASTTTSIPRLSGGKRGRGRDYGDVNDDDAEETEGRLGLEEADFGGLKVEVTFKGRGKTKFGRKKQRSSGGVDESATQQHGDDGSASAAAAGDASMGAPSSSSSAAYVAPSSSSGDDDDIEALLADAAAAKEAVIASGHAFDAEGALGLDDL